MHLAPGDPAEMVAGVTATAQDIQQVRDNLGLDALFIVQYGRYLSNAAQGDLPNPPFDCPFYIRCPIAQAVCSEQKPEWEAYHETHYVACHFKDASKLEVIYVWIIYIIPSQVNVQQRLQKRGWSLLLIH